MSNKSYALLNNSTDKLDTSISVSEPPPSDALRKRYLQIAFAVGLYWYVNKKNKPNLLSNTFF